MSGVDGSISGHYQMGLFEMFRPIEVMATNHGFFRISQLHFGHDIFFFLGKCAKLNAQKAEKMIF